MILSSYTSKKGFTRGFTLVELMISVGIFALMTALLLAKYGTFNQGILLTNLAYDVALTLRTAQSYGLNVKSAPLDGGSFSDKYNYPYGIHFTSSASGQANTRIIFFADKNSDRRYQVDEMLSTYTIKRGSYVQKICSGDDAGSSCAAHTSLDITFKRPDPEAIIDWGNATTDVYAEITLQSTDGGNKKVIVRKTGQIAVSN